MSEWHFIRRATADDVDACDRIARVCERRWRSSLGWVRRNSLAEAVDKRTLHVAEFGGEVVGFVYFTTPTRGKNEGWNVIHALATDPDLHGRGIGRSLLYSVPTPIRLLCPVTVNDGEPNPANGFYKSAGMLWAGDGGRLNRWELRILPILVRGGNSCVPEIARASGWAYGVRSDYRPFDYPVHVDVHWKDYVWTEYMDKIRDWRPVAALTADYEHPSQKDVMLAQVQDLRDAGVIRVMVCPKFHGAVRDIPADCIVAISIPSSYAGFLPHPSEVAGRKVHLLGGSPLQWFGSARQPVGYITVYESAGAQVVSVDGNMHIRAGYRGGFWRHGQWNNSRRPVTGNELAIESGKNILKALNDNHISMQLTMEGIWPGYSWRCC